MTLYSYGPIWLWPYILMALYYYGPIQLSSHVSLPLKLVGFPPADCGFVFHGRQSLIHK